MVVLKDEQFYILFNVFCVAILGHIIYHSKTNIEGVREDL